jgi:hypothetical protein
MATKWSDKNNYFIGRLQQMINKQNPPDSGSKTYAGSIYNTLLSPSQQKIKNYFSKKNTY